MMRIIIKIPWCYLLSWYVIQNSAEGFFSIRNATVTNTSSKSVNEKLYNYEVQITVQAIWVYALGIIETVRRQYVICHRKTDNYWTDTSPTDSHNLHLVRYSIHLTAFRTVFEWLRRIFLIRKGNSCTTLSSHNTRQGSTSSKLAEQIPFV
jgi:hypothetical protein